MKFPVLSLLSISLTIAARADPAVELAAAARRLAEAPNYTWILTPDPKVARPLAAEMRGNRDGWQTARFVSEEAPWSVSDGHRRFTRVSGQPWKQVTTDRKPGHLPADRPATIADFVLELVGSMTNVRRDGEAIVAEFRPEALMRELDFGQGAPTAVSGWARFWLKDGMFVRYQTHREGMIRHRDGTRRFDATTELKFTNIGSTEVVIPPDARRLFGS